MHLDLPPAQERQVGDRDLAARRSRLRPSQRTCAGPRLLQPPDRARGRRRPARRPGGPRRPRSRRRARRRRPRSGRRPRPARRPRSTRDDAVGVAGEVGEHVTDGPVRAAGSAPRRRAGRRPAARRASPAGPGAAAAAPATSRSREPSRVHRPHATCQAGAHAARDDRPRTDGRQHGAPPGAGRPRVRRLRRRRRRPSTRSPTRA